MKDLAETVTSRAQYAMRKISKIPGLTAPVFTGYHFKEFTVKFNKPVEEVTRKLLVHGYHAGLSLKRSFPELGETSLFCVTEMHSMRDIDGMVSALREVVG
jgi:glycine dehydrogenase subunit 1